jgi:ribosomal protein S18 acetylase RimI-like enzyme
MESAVRSATSSDLAAVSLALTESFYDDPVMAWAFEQSVRIKRLDAMWRFMAGVGYLPFDACTVLPEGDGAALWLPPGAHLDDAFWAQHLDTLMSAVEGDLERLGLFAAAQNEHHPSDDHWYLLAIGIRPEAQGRGLGGALLAHTLAIADERGEAAYLEATSSRSRALYARYGFEVTSEFNALDSPTVWGMWRPARATAAR